MKTPTEISFNEINGAPVFRLATTCVTFMGGIVAGMAYIFTNFATVRYVDQRYAESINHSDANRSAVETKLLGLKEGIDRVEQTLLRLETRTLDSLGKKH